MKYRGWTVIGHAPSDKKGNRMSLCKCECGVERPVRHGHLKSGHSSGCGCVTRNRTHGMSRTRTYGIWCGIKTRCHNQNETGFENYGGRGIAVCDRWMDFENFLTDMGHAGPKMTIERKDNGVGYEPGNCVWATMKEQQRNRRNNLRIEMNGQIRVLSEWCELLNVNYHTVYGRLVRGLSPENAFGLDGRQSC